MDFDEINFVQKLKKDKTEALFCIIDLMFLIICLDCLFSNQR